MTVGIKVCLLPPCLQTQASAGSARRALTLPPTHPTTLTPTPHPQPPPTQQGVKPFLPKKAAPPGTPPRPGQLLECVVVQGGGGEGSGGGVVLSADAGAVGGAVAREWEGLNIGSLLPGATVTARVRALLSDGLLCSFLTFFTGTVDPFHLGSPPGVDWHQAYRWGSGGGGGRGGERGAGGRERVCMCVCVWGGCVPPCHAQLARPSRPPSRPPSHPHTHPHAHPPTLTPTLSP